MLSVKCSIHWIAKRNNLKIVDRLKTIHHFCCYSEFHAYAIIRQAYIVKYIYLSPHHDLYLSIISFHV